MGETLPGGETWGSRNNATKPAHDAVERIVACKQESIKDGADDDLNLYNGDVILVHEQSASINTHELNSCYESSDEEAKICQV